MIVISIFDYRRKGSFRRQLISGIDALAIAEFSSFDKPVLSGVLPPPW